MSLASMRKGGCEIYRLDPEKPDRRAIERAAEVLRRGGLVAFPTETVYGLGADALNPRAAAKIFEVKGRPPDNPLIVHVSSLEMARTVAEILGKALRLVEKLWPGPLTLVLPRKPVVPDVVTAGLETVAVRMPAHKVALELVKAAGRPVAAPSANPSGKPSPTSGEHVIRDLDCMVDVILDAGETYFGVESTIIDLTRTPPVLLRPGPIPVDVLERLLGEKILVPPEARGVRAADRPLAPGMKYRHYAPDTPLILVDTSPGAVERVVEAAVREAARARGLRVALVGPDELVDVVALLLRRRGVEPAAIFRLGPLADTTVAARRLFKTLRRIDELGSIDVAIVLPFPEKGIGLAVMNRLRKAASRRVGA
ncbi:L-threonylcarbamoyladenylate synthase [Aeropyrum pernix]|nr:L-threonylcarbamoyladenylate synthase [Aeropyrum pernix]